MKIMIDQIGFTQRKLQENSLKLGKTGIMLTGLGLLASAGSYILRTHSEIWYHASTDEQKVEMQAINRTYDSAFDD